MKKPFFSIVIPTYNRASDLQFALYCILRQSFSDFEVVISDNCSTDNTKAVVQTLKNKKIRYSRAKKAVGNALNMERAIKMAQGEYVFLHSDDDFFLYKYSLGEICKEIVKHNPGYIRVNYMSLSLDKKRVFSYKVNKPFIENEYISPFLENKKVSKFIVDSDPYFITGIIFKNTIPSNIKMVDSDPVPWVRILFYAIKNFGACFIAQKHIVASWSRRVIKPNAKHHIYLLINGKLRGENFFNAIGEKLKKEDYQKFLHNELMTHYVSQFPGVKVHVGNKVMFQMAGRIELLDPAMKKTFAYWACLIGTLIVPRRILKIIRDIYIYTYSRISKVDNNEEVVDKLRELREEYLHKV
ncbi:MAG: glycosyltransferase family 2 protein [Candidatus Parcubacteria bacterium]|nr:glycosyltransferase family 2 protein [Candidatus Parcubacteria bacterium]